jgi:pimeloyl-ACP methyl ester carboxylesterase
VTAATGLELAVAEPAGEPRATLYALHGGGLNGDYWDCRHDRALSLAALGVQLGFRVAHPDRPGHRANRERWPRGLAARDEAALHVATITARWGDDAPVVLVGHSAGSIVALHAAAEHAWPGLLGVDYSGVGITLDPGSGDDDDRRTRFWGPTAAYPPATWEKGGRPTEPTIPHDGTSAREWSQVFAGVAAAVRVPVRVTFAATERWWGGVDDVLAAVAAGFTATPSVTTAVEPGAGHNLSLGFAARAYHLQVCAFAERCLRR